jgi:adenosylhomocysteine nucleosidase
MESEMAPIRAETNVTATHVLHGRTVSLGTIGGQEVALVITGPSMVNAAMVTEQLLDRYAIRAIVFSGIAGGVNPGLHVGDVTIPAQWGNYQEHAFARETPTGFEPPRSGFEFGHFGMMFPQGTQVPVRGARPDSLARRFWFAVDSASLAVAARASSGMTLKRCAASGDCIATEPRIVLGGNGVSGPTFVDNAQYREWVWTTFKADALDMETAAVGIVAYQHHVPYIAFRSLSDLAGGSAMQSVRGFGRLAAENAAAVAMAYVKALPPVRP